MGVIRELESKVVKQQTQKLQELGSSITSKGTVPPVQENPSLGPMEETNLDFENLVLGKKSPQASNIPSSSPPIAAYQSSQAFSQPQGFTNPRPTTPLSSIMTPMQPTSQTPPPPTSNTFFQPLKPSPYTATTGPASAVPPRNGLYPTPNAAFNAPTVNSTSGFSANPWSAPLNLSLPTIAPPPAKASSPMNQGQTPQANSGGNSGLEKYQSLL